MPPQLLHGGFWRLKGFLLAARECDFWQQIHYLPFWGRLRGGRQMAGGGGRLGLWEGFLSPCGRGGFFAALYLGRLRGGRRAVEERACPLG